MKILLGADPEVFVRERKTGNLASAHGLVKGDKKNPFPVPLGAVQVDGMALEFNIDPAEEGDFERNITAVMRTLEKLCPKYDLVPEAVAHFGHDLIQAQPFEARELGCEPDFNAWDDGKPNRTPDVDTPFRTGAGHIHIGWCDGVDNNHWEHIEACHMVCKQLDFFLALPALLFDKGGSERRRLYGKAGAYRPKSYGVEYRTLSNFWISEPRYIRWVEQVTRKAIDLLMEDRKAYVDMEGYISTVLDHINGEDWACNAAGVVRQVIDAYDIELPEGWKEVLDHNDYFMGYEDTYSECPRREACLVQRVEANHNWAEDELRWDLFGEEQGRMERNEVRARRAVQQAPQPMYDYVVWEHTVELKDMDYDQRLMVGGINVHKRGR